MTSDHIEAPSVGEILRDEFLDPLGITPYRLAKELQVATSSILDIVHDRRGISVDMSLRLSKFFGTSHRFWLNLQNELDTRKTKIRIMEDLERIRPFTRIA